MSEDTKPKKMPYGQYRGKLIYEIKDIEYLIWSSDAKITWKWVKPLIDEQIFNLCRNGKIGKYKNGIKKILRDYDADKKNNIQCSDFILLEKIKSSIRWRDKKEFAYANPFRG